MMQGLLNDFLPPAPVLVCAECGTTNVYVRMWCEVNADNNPVEHDDDNGKHIYRCGDCDVNVDVTTPAIYTRSMRDRDVPEDHR